jgi:hypothetical protein
MSCIVRTRKLTSIANALSARSESTSRDEIFQATMLDTAITMGRE